VHAFHCPQRAPNRTSKCFYSLTFTASSPSRRRLRPRRCRRRQWRRQWWWWGRGETRNRTALFLTINNILSVVQSQNVPSFRRQWLWQRRPRRSRGNEVGDVDDSVIVIHYLNYSFSTARRYAKRGICRRRVSVTLRYCIKTAKHRIMQITPHDSPVTLLFWHQSSRSKFQWDHPLLGWQMQVRWVKIRHFRRKTRYNSKTVQDRCIVSIKVE